MNKISLLLLVAIVSGLGFSCQQQSDYNFKLDVNITGGGDKVVYLQQRKDGDWVKADSTEMVADKASFQGNVDLPEFFYVTIKDERGFMPVFIEQGEISITSNINNLRDVSVEGSTTNKAYSDFMTSLGSFDVEGETLGKRYQEARAANDELAMKTVEEEYMALEERKSNSILDYAKENNESVVSAFIIMSNSYMFELDQLDEVTSGFGESIKGSYYVEFLQKRVNTLKSVAVGQPYVDFTLNDTEGNPIPLSSVVDGKYTLVDFWASWCGPCRAENPNVVIAYNKYHDKGFDVFGVSFDKDHDKWVEAIAKDELTWPHVSDLQYWSSAAGKLYGVQSIPHNVLISPDGIIIEKNLRGQELQDKLADLFAE